MQPWQVQAPGPGGTFDALPGAGGGRVTHRPDVVTGPLQFEVRISSSGLRTREWQAAVSLANCCFVLLHLFSGVFFLQL